LRAQQNIEGKDNLGEFPEPFTKLASLVCECGYHKIQAQVYHERILEDRIVHSSNLAGRTVVPVSANVGKTKKLCEVRLAWEFKWLTGSNTEAFIFL
jgi:hypothetical protein